MRSDVRLLLLKNMSYPTKRRLLYTILLLACSGLFLFTCERLNISKIVKIETQPVSYRSQYSAALQGAIYDCGEETIIQHGHCWATDMNPDIIDAHTSLGPPGGPKPFLSPITDLVPGTIYYYRAYCTDGIAVYYGTQRSFMTLPVGIDAIFGRLPTGTAPLIDGIEDKVWQEVPGIALEKKFQYEMPTVKAYWRGMWDDSCLYVLVNVEDDDHHPAWEPHDSMLWRWDLVELYFDINDILEDGYGPAKSFSGHYQCATGFSQYGYDHENFSDLGDYCCIDSYYAYKLYGQNYVYEWRIPLKSFFDKNAFRLDVGKIPEKVIGFDVTVVDQDEGVTTIRQRKVWQNDGIDTDESWNNMDRAGKVVFR
jgi:hypothetical protein